LSDIRAVIKRSWATGVGGVEPDQRPRVLENGLVFTAGVRGLDLATKDFRIGRVGLGRDAQKGMGQPVVGLLRRSRGTKVDQRQTGDRACEELLGVQVAGRCLRLLLNAKTRPCQRGTDQKPKGRAKDMAE
jgi:hypothetical protein